MSEVIAQSEQSITEFMRGMAAGGDALRELKKCAAAGGTEFETLQKVIAASGGWVVLLGWICGGAGRRHIRYAFDAGD